MSNCDRKYHAFAFSISSFIQCNIVNNYAIESVLYDISYILVRFLSLVDLK